MEWRFVVVALVYQFFGGLLRGGVFCAFSISCCRISLKAFAIHGVAEWHVKIDVIIYMHFAFSVVFTM